MAQLRPKIVKLAKIIGGVTGITTRIDENAPEYYCMAGILTDEEADVAIAAGLRKERTAAYLARKVGKTVQEVQPLLDKLQAGHQCRPVLTHLFRDQPHLDGGPVEQQAQQQPDRPLHQQDLVPTEPEAELEHQQGGEHGQQRRPEGGNVAISIAGRSQHRDQFSISL